MPIWAYILIGGLQAVIWIALGYSADDWWHLILVSLPLVIPLIALDKGR
jgi:hypothetical protein